MSPSPTGPGAVSTGIVVPVEAGSNGVQLVLVIKVSLGRLSLL